MSKLACVRGFAVIAVLLSLALGATAEPATGYSSAPAAEETFEQKVLRLMNAERAKCGLAPLSVDPLLSKAASDRLLNMRRGHYFAHVSPDGLYPADFIRHRGYEFSVVGENLATGFRTADGVIRGWMDSPTHADNVLALDYTDAGIAVMAGTPDGKRKGFTVVALYGVRQMPAVTLAEAWR